MQEKAAQMSYSPRGSSEMESENMLEEGDPLCGIAGVFMYEWEGHNNAYRCARLLFACHLAHVSCRQKLPTSEALDRLQWHTNSKGKLGWGDRV